MRVLLLAELCHPHQPSLPVVGYKLCREISRLVESVVVTQVRYRDVINGARVGEAEVAYLDSEYLARPLDRLSSVIGRGNELAWTFRTATRWPAYLAFEWEAWKRYKADLATGRFDLVHRVTPMSPTTPSPMAKWSPVPFVIGPLNGGLRWPRAFAAERRREREWLARFRGAHRFLPYYRATYKSSAAILAAFKHTMDDLPASAGNRVFDFPEVGIDPELFHAGERAPARHMNFLFVGRLVPCKCVDAAVAAFAASRTLRQHRLRIIGDGPERARLEALVRDSGLESVVELAGSRTQAEVAQAMRDADVFVFPSIRELGAGVVVEAMASGLACVVVDYGGPGGLIDDRIGIKIPLGSRGDLVTGFRQALESLVSDPSRARRLGDAAHQRAMARYTWQAKARHIVEVYERVLNGSVEADRAPALGPRGDGGR